jgi:hypothetical protein
MGSNETEERIVRTFVEGTASTGSCERYETQTGRVFRQAEPKEPARDTKRGGLSCYEPY